MAIGINKSDHHLLMQRIDQLLKEEKETEYWLMLRHELEEAYNKLHQSIQETKNSADHYNTVCQGMRPVIASALRKKRKKE